MTPDEFVELVLQVVKANLDPRTHEMTLALVGERLKQIGKEKAWKSFGHKSLLTFFETLKEQGRVELVRTQRGAWAVRLGLGEAAPSAAQSPTRFVPLLRLVWFAFVLSTPTGQRYINRANGEVRIGLDGPPSVDDDWVEIEPISEAVQKDWAKTFVEENGIADRAEVCETLQDPAWHREFPDALGRSSPEVRARWNRVRSQRIYNLVEQWSIDHGIRREFLFQFQTPVREPEKISNEPLALVSAADPMEHRRTLILRALASLPTERLLEIPIPAAALFDAIEASTATQK